MRGAVAEQLPAAVRTLLSSEVSENVLPVFLSLGYRVDHELLKEGATYCCVRQGVPLDVDVLAISKVRCNHGISAALLNRVLRQRDLAFN
jgi:mediator of RNA polymerase II transcription subunit 18